MADQSVWRLTRPKYAPGLDGLGAKKTGGRWNSPGLAAVYTASSLSLAILETFVHLPAALRDVRALPAMRAIELSVPADLFAAARVEATVPLERESRKTGDDWLRRASSAVLQVPSAMVPLECNYVLNPVHPDFERIRLVADHDFAFDGRLVAATG
ncbi:MAG: RES family NAD+ phosphorylase [Pseudomonadota bacterium]